MRSFSAFALALGCVLAVSACTATGGLTPSGAQVLNTAVEAGQLFCAAANGPTGAAVVAVINAADAKAVTVTGKTQAIVAATCPIIAGVKSFPVSPPANPAAVPMVAVVPPSA